MEEKLSKEELIKAKERLIEINNTIIDGFNMCRDNDFDFFKRSKMDVDLEEFLI